MEPEMNDIFDATPRLFFDIETKANSQALHFMQEPSAPSNYKDPVKIAAYIEEKKAEQVDKAALDPDFGSIVAIGYRSVEGIGKSGETKVLVAETLEQEREIIQEFWKIYDEHHGFSGGYNIIGFDFPYLLRRSMDLNVVVPTLPNLSRYNNYMSLDLMQILYGGSGFKSLKFVVDRYGIDNPLPDLDGSKVSDMDTETLKAYCANDVDMTVALYELMHGVYF